MPGPEAGNSGPLVLTFADRVDVALEVLAAARPLADAWGGRLVALLVGAEASAQACEAITRGADEVWNVSAEAQESASAEVLTDLLHGLVAAERPAAVLIGATVTGQEVAARLGQRLRVGCASSCMSLEAAMASPQGEPPGAGRSLIVERRVYGGRFTARQVLADCPLLATIPPRRFDPAVADATRTGVTRDIPFAPTRPPRLRLLQSRPRTSSHVKIEKADTIVAAGRGVRQAEDLQLLRELADLLHGEVAGSRPLIDDLQWLPVNLKVGLSGSTVRPRLYVACGIAGQIEHVVGMRGSRVVVAINPDATAPIHQDADYSVMGDLYEVVPALVRALRA